MTNSPQPNPSELDPAARSGPAEAERRARQTMEENALNQQLEISRAHEDALMENNKRSQESDQRRHENAIEMRVTGGDVPALNDKAEMEVYGSKGRTYYDPKTGNIIATPEKPTKGKLEEIASNPRYGKTEAERKKAAKAYENEILSLVDNDGFELAQAKLIMDLREKDKAAQIHLAGRLEADGMSRKDAVEKAHWKYVDKDAERLNLIKTEGAFTEEDYARVRRGGDLYSIDQPTLAEEEDDPTKIMESEKIENLDSMEAFYIEPPEEERFETEAKREEKLAKETKDERETRIAREEYREQYNKEGVSLLYDLGTALNKYAALQAKFEGRATSIGKKKVEKARKEYENLRREANIRIIRHLQSKGFNNEQITRKLLAQDKGEYDEVEVEEGTQLNETSRGEAGLVRDVTRQEMEKQEERKSKESKFIKWWVNRSRKNRSGKNASTGESPDIKTIRRHADQLDRIGDTEEMIRKSQSTQEDNVYMIEDVSSAHFDGAKDTKK